MSEAELQNLLLILRESFQQIFAERFDCMLLYGSRARGDARLDSDIDILVVLHGDFDYGWAINCTSELVARLSLENDITISRTFVSSDRFELEKNPFLLDVKREGLFV